MKSLQKCRMPPVSVPAQSSVASLLQLLDGPFTGRGWTGDGSELDNLSDQSSDGFENPYSPEPEKAYMARHNKTGAFDPDFARELNARLRLLHREQNWQAWRACDPPLSWKVGAYGPIEQPMLCFQAMITSWRLKVPQWPLQTSHSHQYSG